MKTIAVICGGDSSEREVSVLSTLNTLKHIDRQKYYPVIVFIEGTRWYVLPADGQTSASVLKHEGASLVDKNDFSFEDPQGKERKRFDAALIMIHGTPGENGLLQGYLEMLKVPFTSCSSFVSAITFDKHSCKRFLDFAGVKMAADTFISKNRPYSLREIIRQVGLPMFVKPTVGGSSFGVTKVKTEGELQSAIDKAFSECGTILAEAAVKGREMTCGVFMFHGKITALPVTEIVTEREFFDYEAKYLGESQEICPARITPALSAKIQNLTEQIYSYMGCRGVVRMDYIVTDKNDIYFLETNTVPGMTEMSLVPNMLRVAGIDIMDFITSLIEEAFVPR
ncbi:MAG: D-alanine--D-alanine ligase [Bacteroidales bacterium]|nr:D-alanine--D-alanine ligase [Bacteroidales bacterium]